MESDETLYILARQGSEEAFRKLYQKYEASIFTFIYRRLKSRQEAEDVFDETMLSIIHAAEADFIHGSFAAWIYKHLLMTIRNFTELTPKILQDKLKQVQQAKAKGLILDLRGNEGGLFEKTLESIDHFLPANKLIVRSIKRDQVEEDILSKTPATIDHQPPILIFSQNGNSWQLAQSPDSG
ncbi:MAG: S41 family peptidase [Oligoflexus sp.]